MHVHALAWIVLAGIILTMIVVDIVAHVRTPHEPTLKEAVPSFGRSGDPNTARNTSAAISPKKR